MTFPHTATTERLTTVGAKTQYASSGTVQCFLQPLDDQVSQLYGITFGKAFQGYIPYSADVLQSDRLIIEGKKYNVRGLREHNYGNLKHKRLTLELL